MNVGRVNLYLKKYEIGGRTKNFDKPLLIAAGAGDNSFLQITMPDFNFNRNIEYDIKLYLIDDFGERYLSTGGLIIEDVDVETIQPFIFSQGIPPTAVTSSPTLPVVKIKQPRIKAWSYKTEKYNWTI